MSGNRVVILTGSDTRATCESIEAILSSSDSTIAGIIHDEAPSTGKKKWNALKRNLRREGLAYLFQRSLRAAESLTDRLASRLVRQDEVDAIVSKAFPDRAYSLARLSQLHGIPLLRVADMNSEQVASAIRDFDADLGVVLGTRILKPIAFAAPRLGSINVHKGRVPEYRGMPAGFWELYDGAGSAGVTIHFVDAGLDTGDIVTEGTVPVDIKDTPKTLRSKLNRCANELLPAAVDAVLSGTAQRRPQPKTNHKPRTNPTLRQLRNVYARVGRRPPGDSVVTVAKKAFYACLYFAGVWKLSRLVRRMTDPHRAAIVLYHRVNDECDDPLTASVEGFARHLLLLKKHYRVLPSDSLVQGLRERKLPQDAACIHFDDCYRDVHGNAARLLQAAGLPASAFISSGFIGTQRRFQHDIEKYPLKIENMSADEVRGLKQFGVAVGSHTVNHANMGRCTQAEAETEMRESKRELEALLNEPVIQFTFPFGAPSDSRPDMEKLAHEAGYTAVFSAYGGFASPRDPWYDIRRFGVDDSYGPLEFLMELEGLSLRSLAWRLWAKRRLT